MKSDVSRYLFRNEIHFNSIKPTLAMFVRSLCVFEKFPHTVATAHFLLTNQLFALPSNCEPINRIKNSSLNISIDTIGVIKYINRFDYLPQTAAKLPIIPLQRSVYHRCNEKFCVFFHNLNRIWALHVRTKINEYDKIVD